jgi:hypothetical protein
MGVMAFDLRPCQIDQLLLLLATLRKGLPGGHLALVVAGLVSQLEGRGILRSDGGGRGPRGSHPQMLLTQLRYGYCVRVCSLGKLEACCETDVAFRVLAGGESPNFGPGPTFATGTWQCSRNCAGSCDVCVERLGWSSWASSLWMGRTSRPTPRSSQYKAMSYPRLGAGYAPLRIVRWVLVLRGGHGGG